MDRAVDDRGNPSGLRSSISNELYSLSSTVHTITAHRKDPCIVAHPREAKAEEDYPHADGEYDDELDLVQHHDQDHREKA